MRAIADAVAGVETAEEAKTAALAVLRTKLDWPNESDAPLFSRFANVAEACFRSLKSDGEGGDAALPEALGAFERWYVSAHGAPFWILFEQPMAETPRVDF